MIVCDRIGQAEADHDLVKKGRVSQHGAHSAKIVARREMSTRKHPIAYFRPESNGSLVRPSALVAAVARCSRSPFRKRCRSTTTPRAGSPREASNTCVDNRPMLSAQPQAKAAVGRPRFGIDASLAAAFDYGVPGAVVGLQMNFSNRRNFSEHLVADLINQLLNAS